MATLFILLVLAYFVIVSDVGTFEKFVVAMLCGAVALLPTFVESTRLPAAIAQGVFGVYVCLRMTYVRAKA
jgi:uncharacterized MnhB-related membrane protein